MISHSPGSYGTTGFVDFGQVKIVARIINHNLGVDFESLGNIRQVIAFMPFVINPIRGQEYLIPDLVLTNVGLSSSTSKFPQRTVSGFSPKLLAMLKSVSPASTVYVITSSLGLEGIMVRTFVSRFTPFI